MRDTRRAVIVDEGWRSGSFSAEIAMRINEQEFWSLDGPIARVCTEEVPIPYPKHLEDAALPSAAKIVAAASVIRRHRQTAACRRGDRASQQFLAIDPPEGQGRRIGAQKKPGVAAGL